MNKRAGSLLGSRLASLRLLGLGARVLGHSWASRGGTLGLGSCGPPGEAEPWVLGSGPRTRVRGYCKKGESSRNGSTEPCESACVLRRAGRHDVIHWCSAYVLTKAGPDVQRVTGGSRARELRITPPAHKHVSRCQGEGSCPLGRLPPAYLLSSSFRNPLGAASPTGWPLHHLRRRRVAPRPGRA